MQLIRVVHGGMFTYDEPDATRSQIASGGGLIVALFKTIIIIIIVTNRSKGSQDRIFNDLMMVTNWFQAPMTNGKFT